MIKPADISSVYLLNTCFQLSLYLPPERLTIWSRCSVESSFHVNCEQLPSVKFPLCLWFHSDVIELVTVYLPPERLWASKRHLIFLYLPLIICMFRKAIFFKCIHIIETHEFFRLKTFSIFKDFIYLFLERGEGREKERTRNTNVCLPLAYPLLGTWPTTQACALTGNRTTNP